MIPRPVPATALALAVAAGLVLAACQRAPVGTPAPRAEQPSVAALRAQGDAALARDDYSGALQAYAEILRRDSTDLEVRYRVAVAYSHLGRTEDAAAAFTWVAQHGPADREETRLARQWLAAREDRRDASSDQSDQPAASPPDPGSAVGQVKGKTEWAGLDPGRPKPGLQLLLVGDDETTRGRRYGARTRLTEPYEFTGVVPGRYRLLAQVGHVRLWEQTVTVTDSGPTVVDLTQATSIAPPDALAPRS